MASPLCATHAHGCCSLHGCPKTSASPASYGPGVSASPHTGTSNPAPSPAHHHLRGKGRGSAPAPVSSGTAQQLCRHEGPGAEGASVAAWLCAWCEGLQEGGGTDATQRGEHMSSQPQQQTDRARPLDGFQAPARATAKDGQSPLNGTHASTREGCPRVLVEGVGRAAHPSSPDPECMCTCALHAPCPAFASAGPAAAA